MENVGLLVILHITFSLLFLVSTSRYDYLFFENFELSKDLFVKEQNLVRELTISRQNLYNNIKALTSGIDNISQHYPDSYPGDISGNEKWLNLEIRNIRSRLDVTTMSPPGTEYLMYNNTKNERNLFSNIENMYNQPEALIVEAAAKGVIMLQETYEQNITEYLKGHLRLKSGIKRNGRSIDSLKVDDLASMSTIAFDHYKWYDTSLKYLKEAFNLFYSLTFEEQRMLPHNLEESLIKMKKQYPKYHNDLVVKKTNQIGPEWKIFPNMVDTGII